MVRLSWLAVLTVGVLLAGCGSTEQVVTMTPEQRFEKAKALYDAGDYLEAINEFTVITLQHQGSSVAPDAQYYIGECRFARGEYLLAAFEYSIVRRNYTASAKAADAQYKTGLSYFYYSPSYKLDQQYTKKAIDELQAFVEYYPSHPMAVDASNKIRELNNRLAEKQYRTAQLYARMGSYRAALNSFDIVLEKYHDSDYAPAAVLDKADLLMQRNRSQEAATLLKEFVTKFPNNVLVSRAKEMLQTLERQQQKGASPSKDSGDRRGAGNAEAKTAD